MDTEIKIRVGRGDIAEYLNKMGVNLTRKDVISSNYKIIPII